MTGDPNANDLKVEDNPAARRYEARVGSEVAGVIYYDGEPDRIRLIHTEVDQAFEGKGIASRLVSGALADIRRRGLTVVPICRFVRSYLERHPEDADVVARD